MPPSPALRCSPSRETRANNHKRGHSFEGGLLFREKDDDLALFNEMQTREKEDFLLQSSDDLEATFSLKLRNFSDYKLGISIPARGESSDLLNVEGDKNDYEWLLTPPDTPLFPSLDDEPSQHSSARRGRPRSQPISISRSSTMEKSYRSSRGSASPNRLSPSPRSTTSTLQSRGRQSLSARNLSPSPTQRPATPSRRPSTPPSKPSTPVPRSSTPTPRRLSTGSSGSVPTSGIRGVSPVKTGRGNSASPKIRAWQTNIPGFSSDAPPNLRTSLADRPASYVRGSSPASINGRRQSMSPTASRSVSSSHSHDRDPFSSHSKGSVVSSGDDDVDSIQTVHVGSLDRPGSRRVGSLSNNKGPSLAKKPTKTASPSSAPKRSFDSAIRQMDHRKPQNMFRPLLSSVPSTTFYAGKSSSVHRPLVSRNSSVTTSSNASSDQGTSAPPDTEESDHNHDDVAPFLEVAEEVFAFDTMEMEAVNETEVNTVAISEPEESDVVEASEASEASLVNDDFSEVDSLETTTVCRRCGTRFRASEAEEHDARVCPECKEKEEPMRVVTMETPVIGDTCLVLSTNISEENHYHSDEAENMTSDQSHNCLQENEQKVEELSAVDHNESPNPRVDFSEGTGISLLLKRTSSIKSSVVQARTFSAANIPYDSLSYSKDSASSVRSNSVGHSSFSPSSSADFGSRQTDNRVQRQLSGKKLDMEYHRNDNKTTKPQSTGSSSSGFTNLPLSRSTNEDSLCREQLLASERTDVDVTDVSFTRTFLAEEDDDHNRKDSELFDPLGCGSEEKVPEALTNSEPSTLENGESPKYAKVLTEHEAVDKMLSLSSEEHNEPVISMSEIETENHHPSTPGSLSDDGSLESKSSIEESSEVSLSNKDTRASAMESKISEHEHDILEQESTVVIESHTGSKTRSLTLEEATDTILFCRSIVHDLAYQAAAVAMEKDKPDIFEGSQPTVTILGKSNFEKRDPPRGRSTGNRPSKPQKMRKKRTETELKTPPSAEENDENALEPLQRNVRSPNKLDNSLKPPKLESKCNCIIM